MKEVTTQKMRKFSLFLIIVIGLAIALPMIYILVPAAKPMIGDFFGSITPMIVTAFTNAGNWFLGLPYGLWMIVGIAIVFGIMMDRYAHSLYYGMRRRMVYTSYQDAGFQTGVGLSSTAVAPVQSQPTSTVVAAPPPMKLEDSE
jgi:hypothetical protein